MDPAMMALKSKRMGGYSSSVKEEMPSEGMEHKSEMSEYWQRIQDMDAKLDQILALLGEGEEGEETEMPKEEGMA